MDEGSFRIYTLLALAACGGTPAPAAVAPAAATVSAAPVEPVAAAPPPAAEPVATSASDARAPSVGDTAVMQVLYEVNAQGLVLGENPLQTDAQILAEAKRLVARDPHVVVAVRCPSPAMPKRCEAVQKLFKRGGVEEAVNEGDLPNASVTQGDTFFVGGTVSRVPKDAASATGRQKPHVKKAGACAFPQEADAKDIDRALVMLQVDVSASGAAESVKITTDPGFGFGAAAKACAMTWTYEPARDEQNRTTRSSFPLRVRFDR